jgi:hypothetical protein
MSEIGDFDQMEHLNLMNVNTAKPVLDAIAKQMREIWQCTETAILTPNQMNDVGYLNSLYIIICRDYLKQQEFKDALNANSTKMDQTS